MLIPLYIKSAASAGDAEIDKKNLGFWKNNDSNIKWWSERHYENSL